MNNRLLVLSFFLFLPALAFAQAYTIERVVDCDTLKLSNGERVRLIGVDCPESKVNNRAKRESKKTGQDLQTITAMGQEAKEFIKGLGIEGKEVRLEYDVEKRDRYGRLLAYVWVPVFSHSYTARDKDGKEQDFNPWDVADSFSTDPGGAMGVLPELLNAYIVRNGYASPYTVPPNVKYADLFQKFYKEARDKKRGLWK